MKWLAPFTGTLAFLGLNGNDRNSVDRLTNRMVDYGIKTIAAGTHPEVEYVIPRDSPRPSGMPLLRGDNDSIVAVHGLDGHWKKTWCAENEVFWLQDLLPFELENARILSYGYDSRTHGSTPVSDQYIWQHATALISDLTLLREETKTLDRPIIFLVHSLGGLVVKSALIHADSTRDGHLQRHHAIKSSTYGLIFLGTPHQGGNGVDLGNIMVNIASAVQHTSHKVLKHLAKHSEWLQQQQSQYVAISADFDTVCFYETYKTPLPGLGHLMVVPRYSAVIQGQRNLEEIPLNADHRQMTKFESKDDENFKRVSRMIRRMVVGAREKYARAIRPIAVDRGSATQDSSDSFTVPLHLPRNLQTAHFTGRDDVLLRVHAALTEYSGKSSSLPVVLIGQGGIGKTQIAIEYARRYQESYRYIIWIDGTSSDSMQRSFFAFASQLWNYLENYRLNHTKIYGQLLPIFRDEQLFDPFNSEPGFGSSKPRSIYESLRSKIVNSQQTQSDFDKLLGRNSVQLSEVSRIVLDWLALLRKSDWLMIFDNVDEINAFDVRNFMPVTADGSIIVTSRRPEASRYGKGVLIDELSQDDALNLLLVHAHLIGDLKESEIKSASHLVKRLGNLPLAIEQAGAYVHSSSISFSKYLELFETDSLSLLKSAPAIWNYRNDTVLTTWEISFATVQEHNPLAAQILTLSAFLGKDHIGATIFKSVLPEGESYDRALVTLQSYSLVKLEAEYGHFSLHPMIQWWIQKRMSQETQAVSLRTTIEAVRKFSTRSDRTQDDEILHAHLDALAENFRTYYCKLPIDATVTFPVPSIPESRSEVVEMTIYATYYCVCHQLSSLYTWFQDRIWQDTKPLPVWQSLYRLGVVFRNLGLYEKEEALYWLALNQALKKLPLIHPSVLTIVGDLSYSLLKQRQLSAALEWYKWALWARNLVLGQFHPATTGALNGIGLVLLEQGQHDLALEFLTKAFLGRRKRLGLSHPMTLNVLGNIISLIHRSSHKDKAYWLQMYFDSVSQSSHKTPQEKMAAGSATIRAWVMHEDCSKANRQINQTSKYWRQSFDKRYSSASRSVGFFSAIESAGDVCCATGDPETALEHLDQLLRLLEEIHGGNLNIDTIHGDLPKDCSKLASASMFIHHSIGRCYSRSGQHQEALLWILPAYHQMLNCDNALKPRILTFKILDLLTDLSFVYSNLDEHNDALEMSARAFYIEQYACSSDSSQCDDDRDYLWDMAISLYNCDRAKEAIEIFEPLVLSYEFWNGECSPEVQKLHGQLARANFRQGTLDRAQYFARQHLVCSIRQNGRDHPEEIKDMEFLARVHLELNEFDEGLALYESAVNGMEKAREHGIRFRNFLEMTYLMYRKGLYAEALKWAAIVAPLQPEYAAECVAWYDTEKESHHDPEPTGLDMIRSVCEKARLADLKERNSGPVER